MKKDTQTSVIPASHATQMHEIADLKDYIHELLEQRDQLLISNQQLLDANTFHETTVENIKNSFTWKVISFLHSVVSFLKNPLYPLFLLCKKIYPYLPHPLQKVAILIYNSLSWISQHFIQNNAHKNIQNLHHQPAYAGEIVGKVSVILPVYNQADTLAESIDSILAQTYENFELIILNDGSTDHINNILDSYKHHPKIRIYTQINQKLPKALTNAFRFATGEYYCWTSGDNIMKPYSLEEHVDFLNAHSSVQMVYSNYEIIDASGAELRNSDFRVHNQKPLGSGQIHLPKNTKNLNTTQDNFIGASFMYRAWTARIIGDYDPVLGVEDYDYWMRINSLFHIEHIGNDKIYYQYRVHDNTLSAKAKELKILEKAQNLLSYDQERRNYFETPWNIEVLKDTSQIENLFLKNGNNDSSKKLLISTWEEGDILRDKKTSEQDFLAVYIEKEINPFSLTEELQYADFIFTGNSATYGLLHTVFHKKILHVHNIKHLEWLVLSTANSLSFWKKTKAPETITLLEPVPYVKKDKIHILVMSPSLDKGGLEQVIYDMVNRIDKTSFKVTVLCTKKKGLLAAQCEENGIEVLLLSTPQEESFKSILTSKAIDIVNVHHLDFYNEDLPSYGGAICASLGVPIVSFLHNMYAWYGDREKNFTREYDKYVSRYIAVSKNVAWYAHTHIGIPYEKIDIVANGVDLEKYHTLSELPNKYTREQFGIKESDYLFLHISSYYGIKGHHALISAMEEIVQTHPEAKILCLGHTFDAGHERSFRNHIARKGLENNVILAGFYEDVHYFYRLADAFVLPSFYEGWSIAMLEAMTFGLPMILTNVGGAPEVIRNDDIGIVIPGLTENISDLNQRSVYRHVLDEHLSYEGPLKVAMGSFLNNKDEWKIKGLEAKEKVQNYDLSTIITKYEQIFKEPVSKYYE